MNQPLLELSALSHTKITAPPKRADYWNFYVDARQPGCKVHFGLQFSLDETVAAGARTNEIFCAM